MRRRRSPRGRPLLQGGQLGWFPDLGGLRSKNPPRPRNLPGEPPGLPLPLAGSPAHRQRSAEAAPSSLRVSLYGRILGGFPPSHVVRHRTPPQLATGAVAERRGGGGKASQTHPAPGL